MLLYARILIPFTPETSEIRKAKAERPTVVYSADGLRLTDFRPVNREWVRLDEVAPAVRMALLATEDHRFYQHPGVDFRRVLGAAVRTVSGDRQGASTITQQLARNLHPKHIGRRATITRKLKELITALKVESVFTKDEILETYLNTVPFLYDAYGIELAARTYFGVAAAELSIEQAATLVGMLNGTYFYNPVHFPERALARRNLVLRQMVRHGYLREERYEALAATPLELDFQRQPRMRSAAPHFTEYVRRWLVRWAARRGYNIYRDSLVVHPTLDSRLQAIAQESVNQWVPALQAIAGAEWSRPEARLLSRSPAAYHRYRRSQASFAYLWEGRPELVRSFVRATPQYRAVARMGIRQSRLEEVPSLALGTSEVTLLEMVSAYATLAAGGIYRQPIVIERIEDRRGRVVYQSRVRDRRAISQETALRVVEKMRGVVDRGTGRRIRTTFGIREDLAGKTGTTQNNVDGWFIGMHPELVAGAWVGFSDPRVSFRTSYWGAGGNNALLISGEFYRRAFRHPETRLAGMRFPVAPAYVERVTPWDRLRGRLADAAARVGEALAEAAAWLGSLFHDPVEDFAPEPPAPRRAAPEGPRPHEIPP